MERPSRLAPLPPSSEALAPVGGERGDAVEAERLREEVQALRIRTLYQMVDELEVTTHGRLVHQKVLWLTNAQTRQFKPDTIGRMLTTLEIASPGVPRFERLEGFC